LLRELTNTNTSQQKISAESMASTSTENVAVTINADNKSP
jgi:hypothetical protein